MRLRIILLLTCMGATLHSADVFEQLMDKKTGRSFNAIVLRDKSGKLIVAMPEGPKELSKLSVRRNPSSQVATRQVDELFGSIETWIRRSRFAQAKTEVTRLSSAIKAFEEELELKLQSSVTSPEETKALKVARAYYRDLQASVEPTIKTLELSRSLTSELKTVGQRVLNTTEFLSMVKELVKLKDITQAIDIARVERRDAIAQTEKKLTESLAAFVKAATTDVVDNWDISPTVNVLDVLEQVAKVDPSYESAQLTIVNALTDASDKVAKGLSPAVYAGFTFKTTPQASRNKLDVEERSLRLISRALSSLERKTFGKKGAQAKAVLSARVTANEKAIAEAKALYTNVKKVAVFHRDAVALHSRSLHDQAISTLKQAEKAAQESGVLSPALRSDIQTKMIEYEGDSLLERLRTPSDMSTAGLEALIAKSAAYAKKHRRDKRLNLPFAEFDRKADELKRFMELRPKLDKLKPTSSLSAEAKIELAIDLRRELSNRTNGVHPVAAKILEQVWEEEQTKIFNDSSASFLSGEWAVDSKTREEVFLGLASRMLEAAQYQKLEALMGKVYEQLGGRSSDFISKAVDLDAKCAFELSKVDLSLAMSIFDRIKKKQPHIFKRLDLDTRLQEVLLKQAKGLHKENRLGDAVSVYERICQTDPHFAALYDVFKTLFALKVKLDPALATDREKRLGLLEEYCGIYGNKMASVSLLLQERHLLLEELTDLWVARNKPSASADAFLARMASHPATLKESQVTADYFALIRGHAEKLRRRIEKSKLQAERDGGIVPVPTSLLDALRKLNGVELKYLYEKNNLHILYAYLAKAKAESYLERGSIQKATALLREIQTDFPAQASELKIDQIISEYETELMLERIRKPLRVRNNKERVFGSIPAMYVDFGALLFWVLFWGIYLLNAAHVDRTKKLGGYHLKHFVVVFSVFALCLVFFLSFGKLPHMPAVVCSLVLPAIIFYALSTFSYGFFPLVYEGRKLAIKKAALKLPLLGSKLTGLAERVAVEERDIPLLKDPFAYKIQKAAQLSDRAAAAEKLRKYLEKIDEAPQGKLDKHSPVALLQYGIALSDLKQNDEAEKILDRHTALDDHSPEAHWRLGLIRYEAKRYDAAIEDFKHSLAERGGDRELMVRLGRCYFETGKFKSALKCFDMVDNPDLDTRFYKARALARLGRLEDSVTCYQELLKENPDDPRTLYSLASSFAVLGKDVKALKVIGMIKEEASYHPHAIGLQGSIFLRNGKIDKAKDHFERALKREENLVPVLHGLGQLLLEEGKLDEAQGMFEKVLRIEPFNGAAAFHLAVALEKKGETPDFGLFEKAMEDPQLFPLASVLAGREKFYEGDYEKAVTLFEGGKAKKPLTSTDLYMLACSQIELGTFDEAQTTIGELGATVSDSADTLVASKLYDLAYRLTANGRYRDAIKVYALVKKAAHGDAKVASHVDTVLTEVSMRSIFELLRDNGLVKAVKLVNTLTQLPESMGYAKRAKHYSGVLDLRRGNFSTAATQFEELRKDYPDDKRILYHLAVALIGSGKPDEAKTILEDLAKDELSNFLTAGVAEARAFVLAAEKKLAEAEQVMAEVKTFEKTPEGDYLNDRIKFVRADFLCRIHDSTRLQFLLADMNEDEKAQVAYLQAVSALEGGEISSVVRNLKPFATKTPENTKLFAILCAKLAKQMMDEGNQQRAITTLEQIQQPPPCVIVVLNHLKVADLLASLESPDEIRTAIINLEKMYEESDDIELQSLILHNLFMLKFKLPMTMEDYDQWDGSEKAWNTFAAFKKAMTDNLDYWNSRLERMQGGPDATTQKFVAREIEHFMSDFNASVLLPAHIGRALACLKQDNPEYLNRHILAVVKLGREEDKLKEFVQRLGITAKHYSDSLAKDDPLQKTWGFVIGYLLIQIAVREALNPKEKSPLRSQLESYLAVRQHFQSPSEFLKAKKVFNTAMLDALQMGIEGKFGKSGDAIEKCLTTKPPGIAIDAQLESALWTLREQARKPSAVDEAINIAQEFERIYQRVLNYSIQRGA